MIPPTLARSLRWTVRKLRNRFTGAGMVLLYHRVSRVRPNPYELCVSPENFAKHLEVLKHKTRPVSLADLVTTARKRTLPRRAVAITFDDGYSDNLTEALPLLEKFDIPATMFVATGLLGIGREFWWDELERVLLSPGNLPPEINLSLDGANWRGSLNGHAQYSVEAATRYSGWTLRDPAPTARHRLFCQLYQRLSTMPPTERARAMDTIQSWSGSGAEARDTHRILSPDDLARLPARGLLSIGAHSVTHPKLDAMDSAARKQEIENSKATLETILSGPVECFSYPHGAQNAATREAVREAGFSYACGSRADVIKPGCDQFDLPRVVVRDWNEVQFADWLEGCLGC